MPRRRRLQVTGLPVHIIQRGNNRQACFFADDDYQFFLDCLVTAWGQTTKPSEKISSDGRVEAAPRTGQEGPEGGRRKEEARRQLLSR